MSSCRDDLDQASHVGGDRLGSVELLGGPGSQNNGLLSHVLRRAGVTQPSSSWRSLVQAAGTLLIWLCCSSCFAAGPDKTADLTVAGMPVSIDLGAVLLALATAGVGSAAIWQFVQTERWHRTDFSFKEVERLYTDQSFNFCRHCLDRDDVELAVPSRQQHLVPGRVSVRHTWQKMIESFERAESGVTETGLGGEAMVYRLAFEDFFIYLNTVHRYVSGGSIKREDLGSLEYYLARAVECEPLLDILEEYYSERVLPWAKSADGRGLGVEATEFITVTVAGTPRFKIAFRSDYLVEHMVDELWWKLNFHRLPVQRAGYGVDWQVRDQRTGTALARDGLRKRLSDQGIQAGTTLAFNEILRVG